MPSRKKTAILLPEVKAPSDIKKILSDFSVLTLEVFQKSSVTIGGEQKLVKDYEAHEGILNAIPPQYFRDPNNIEYLRMLLCLDPQDEEQNKKRRYAVFNIIKILRGPNFGFAVAHCKNELIFFLRNCFGESNNEQIRKEHDAKVLLDNNPATTSMSTRDRAKEPSASTNKGYETTIDKTPLEYKIALHDRNIVRAVIELIWWQMSRYNDGYTEDSIEMWILNKPSRIACCQVFAQAAPGDIVEGLKVQMYEIALSMDSDLRAQFMISGGARDLELYVYEHYDEENIKRYVTSAQKANERLGAYVNEVKLKAAQENMSVEDYLTRELITKRNEEITKEDVATTSEDIDQMIGAAGNEQKEEVERRAVYQKKRTPAEVKEIVGAISSYRPYERFAPDKERQDAINSRKLARSLREATEEKTLREAAEEKRKESIKSKLIYALATLCVMVIAALLVVKIVPKYYDKVHHGTQLFNSKSLQQTIPRITKA